MSTIIFEKKYMTLCASAACAALAVFLLFLPRISRAAEQTMSVTLHVVDEFGQSIQRTPTIALQGCAVERVGITKPREGNSDLFDTTIVFTHAQVAQVCTMVVGARGYVNATPITLGNLADGGMFATARVQLAHALTVTARSVEDTLLPDVDIYFNGESAVYKKDNTYYFAPYTNAGTLAITHPAYVDWQQEGIRLSSVSRTSLTLQGSGSCAQVGSDWRCGGPSPRLTLDIDNEAGNVFIGGKIELFTDIQRTKLARMFTYVPQDGQLTVDRALMYAPVIPGTYYLKVSKSGYNDYHKKIIVNGEGNTVNTKMNLESASSVSPRQSKISFSKTEASANDIDTITINVEARASDASTLNGQTVEITSSRPYADVIVFPNGTTTQSGGQLLAYIRSTQQGESVLTVRIAGKEISTFKSVLFTDATQGGVSTQYSTATSTPSPILADGKESVSITLTVRNAGSATLSNIPVQATSSRAASDTIACADTQTNNLGNISCTFISRVAGTSVLTFYANDVIVEQVAISVSPLTN